MGGKGKSGKTGRFVAGQHKQRLISKPGAGERRRAAVAVAENLKASVEQSELRARVKRLDMLLGRREAAGQDATAISAVRKEAAACARAGELVRASEILQAELERQ